MCKHIQKIEKALTAANTLIAKEVHTLNEKKSFLVNEYNRLGANPSDEDKEYLMDLVDDFNSYFESLRHIFEHFVTNGKNAQGILDDMEWVLSNAAKESNEQEG